MPLPIQTLAPGDTNYIGKHNANYAAIKSAIDALQSQISTTGIPQFGTGFEAMFGPQTSVIGIDSYKPMGSGTVLTVAAGYAWNAGLKSVLSKVDATAIDFAGLGAATYYVYVGADGVPQRVTSPTNALYSVVWTGSAFGAITRTAALAWGADDMMRAQTSTALGTNYDRLDDRLEAGETVGTGDPTAIRHTGGVPPNYVGQAGKKLVVAGAEDGVTFVPDVGGGGANSVFELVEVGETTLVGHENQALTINSVPEIVFENKPYVLVAAVGAIPASTDVVPHILAYDAFFPSNLSGSFIECDPGTTATATAIFNITVDGSIVGTVTFSPGNTVPVVNMPADINGLAGQRFGIISPSTPDATLANIIFTIKGVRKS